ncbi:hypothetical protein [Streptomyces aureus]|uniref:hypothetical protein n=1 Tax=Streptomyces aureus TaxID=193461 RepID=UPI0033DFDB4D
MLPVLVLLVAGGCVAVVAGVSHEASKTVTIEYAVTGDARNVTIAYSVRNDDGTCDGATERDRRALLLRGPTVGSWRCVLEAAQI